MARFKLFPVCSFFVLSFMIVSCQPKQGSNATATDETFVSASNFEQEGSLIVLNPVGDTVCSILIEIADTEFEQERGLMYRHFMPEDAGMLFIFKKEEYRSFWMKNTHLPLDIIYIDANRVIKTIRKNTVPHSEASVPSDAPAQYVLEVNAGFCDIHHIEEGMSIQFSRLIDK